jgi:hypothetical protein
MATANSSLNIAELDFDQIKSNFKQYLKGQDTFNDYNFEGSVISQVLDLLAYNTHYNAYYLNMVANEMFLDTSVKRGSVISHAKLLNYTPSSARSATAIVNVKFNGTTSPNFTIPKYTKFYSHAIDNVNYPFVTLEELTVSTSGGSAQFNNVKIHQGQPVRYTYQVNAIQNPSLIFTLPDSDVDTTTLSVLVYDSSQSTTYTKFELASSHLLLDSTSKVYFLQESLDGKYEIYFGDGVLGKTLISGNVITVEYLTTKGSAPNGAYKFTLMDKIGTYTGTVIDINGSGCQVATGGNEKESIASIKYAAPKAYAAQNRAVTKSDYLELLKRDNPILPIQAVNVWGGEEMTPPQYGKMFICIKPVGGYSITATQKYRLINEYIKPFGVITVVPEIVDIDYTFIKINSAVLYDKTKSIFDPVALRNLLKLAILNFCDKTLNTFDSSFVLPDLITTIKNVDASIITNESTISLQKRFLPIFNSVNSFTLNFAAPIKKGSLYSDYFDYVLNSNIVSNVKIEESPSLYNTIESLNIINGGAGYTSLPTITIYGDGTGATATAELTNGKITNITIITPGSGYTQAVVVVSGGGGSGAVIVPTFSGNIVKLRSYYYNNNIKTILQPDIGEINYSAGIVKIYNFNPYQINNLLGTMSITVIPESTIFYSTRDKIITLDIMDDSAINVTVQSKI